MPMLNCKTHLDAMRALGPELAVLPPETRRFVARLLQDDIDLLSVVAVGARSTTAPDAVECLRGVVAHLIQVKVELLGPIVFDEAGGGTD
ncbi:MAG: hypothetical protein ACREUW_15095 [Burkholderiales bacterium]